MAKKKSKAGRKPIDEKEKATLIGIYIKQSDVELLGGKDELRLLLLDYCKKLIKKQKK